MGRFSETDVHPKRSKIRSVYIRGRKLHHGCGFEGSGKSEGSSRLWVEGEPIEPEYGGPLRMVIPNLWGYKSCKWLARSTSLTRWKMDTGRTGATRALERLSPVTRSI